MPELSAAVRVCHTLAGNEAIKSNHEFITPAHLLWGITRLEAVNSAENAAKIGLSPAGVWGKYGQKWVTRKRTTNEAV